MLNCLVTVVYISTFSSRLFRITHRANVSLTCFEQAHSEHEGNRKKVTAPHSFITFTCNPFNNSEIISGSRNIFFYWKYCSEESLSDMPQIIYDTVLSYNDISKVKSVLWGTADVRLFVGWPLYAAVVLTICLKDLLLFHHWAFSTSWTNCKQHSHSVDF